MNIENIQTVIDHLKTLPNFRFDMTSWAVDTQTVDDCTTDELIHNCGTAGCIGGWTVAVLTPTAGIIGPSVQLEAQILLGLDNDQAYQLFLPPNREQIKIHHAIAVLERLIETGEVNWQ